MNQTAKNPIPAGPNRPTEKRPHERPFDGRGYEHLPPGYQRQGDRIMVPLPAIPRTLSPVPMLTSLHATDGRGEYGVAAFRGNCSGLLIRDLLLYFRPKLVLDPMTGSGTCRDVCQELDVGCISFDLTAGLDACDAENYSQLRGVDFVWLHPPYWKLIVYNNDPRCLSQAPTLDAFFAKLRELFRCCRSALVNGGKIAVLMGDGRERGTYWGLPYRTLQAAEAEGLWLAAPEIVRFCHGATSSKREYGHAFIPLLHEVCWVLEKQR